MGPSRGFRSILSRVVLSIALRKNKRAGMAYWQGFAGFSVAHFWGLAFGAVGFGP